LGVENIYPAPNRLNQNLTGTDGFYGRSSTRSKR
jgi:hypothetical protein